MNDRVNFSKEYLPGYTGHVPYKKEIYGCSMGDVNRIVLGKHVLKASTLEDAPVDSHRNLYRRPPRPDKEALALMLTNKSGKGDNWIGGPTKNVSAQHIPGYQGYVPSIRSENVFGLSYSKATSTSINKEFPKDPGFGKPPSGVERFKTQSKINFSKDNFRRLAGGSPEPADIIDQKSRNDFGDFEFQGIQSGEPNIYMTIQTVGYQGFKSQYRPPTVTMNHRKDPHFNVNSLRPRLGPSFLAQTQLRNSMQTLPSQKFHRASSPYEQQTTESPIPVVGYTGHRMGNRAQGFYGKNFRDSAIQSRNIQKAFASPGMTQ